MLPERCRVIGVSLFRLNFRLYLLHNPIISHHEELFVARDSPEPIQSSNGRCRIGSVWHIKVLNYSMVDAATRIHVSESRSCDCCWLQTQMWYIDSCHSGHPLHAAAPSLSAIRSHSLLEHFAFFSYIFLDIHCAHVSATFSVSVSHFFSLSALFSCTKKPGWRNRMNALKCVFWRYNLFCMMRSLSEI